MPRHCSRFRSWPALAGLAFCVSARVSAGVDPAETTSFLQRTESLRTSDHAQFVRMLEQLHTEAPSLSPIQQWHLRYLDAWQTAYQGDYKTADALLKDVIEHAGDETLAAKASALLMSDMGINRRYEEAFTVASGLIADLPRIKDRLARFVVLANLSQLLSLAGQNDLALKYARMMEDALPPGETLCNPLSKQVIALYNSKKLASTSAELHRAIDTCQAARQTVFANAMWLVLVSLYVDENKPHEAVALLHQIAPGIDAGQYYSHMLASRVELAQAYWELADYDQARKEALAALKISDPGEISGSLRDAYEVLYRVEKKRGNAATALAYYEHYVAQDKGYLDDVSARALAYQVVQQHVLAKKLEAEALSKQNNILRLQQALDAKAMETTRLYNLLLMLLLGSIALWLYRLKRSQLRFKALSSLDGLTGILNHQHFVGEAGRALRQMERKPAPACLVALDLDHFKQVNDAYGHAIGDEVLRHAVTVCRQQLRPVDLFGRLGGEEFGILLPDCPLDQGVDIAHRIRRALAESPMTKGAAVVEISASVGLACTDTCGYELQRLYAEADAALYRAKRAGRNRVVADLGKGDLFGT